MKKFLKNAPMSTKGWIVVAASGLIFLLALVLAASDWNSRRSLLSNIGRAEIELLGDIPLQAFAVLCLIGGAIGAAMVIVGRHSGN
jgi:hypothetical protein